tara:strand:+ start:814 stop:1041 length:228 start_codon:yes stop_codon:yes gene_type:complete
VEPEITLKDLEEVCKKFSEEAAAYIETDIETAIICSSEYGRHFNHRLDTKEKLAQLTPQGELELKKIIENYSLSS